MTADVFRDGPEAAESETAVQPSPVRILHLSDTHFVKDLNTKGSRFKGRSVLVASHDISKIEAFNTIHQRLQREAARLNRPAFDHLLITGDISTDGSREALNNARQFVDEDELYDVRAQWRLVVHGLGWPANRRTVLPGNHDRYCRFFPLQSRSEEFEKVFHDGYERKYPQGRLIASPAGSGSPSILMFVFDSTQVLRWRERLTFDMLARRIACGEVTPAECLWLTR
jgi:hypothetical protein